MSNHVDFNNYVRYFGGLLQNAFFLIYILHFTCLKNQNCLIKSSVFTVKCIKLRFNIGKPGYRVDNTREIYDKNNNHVNKTSKLQNDKNSGYVTQLKLVNN